jgi:hypothetical protein
MQRAQAEVKAEEVGKELAEVKLLAEAEVKARNQEPTKKRRRVRRRVAKQGEPED